ncbi:putative reverse transcriptase domain-containing protein [Tanacetum coccineum]
MRSPDPEEDLEEDDEEILGGIQPTIQSDQKEMNDDISLLILRVAYSADQDPYIAYRVTARMSIRTQAPTPFLSEEVAERVLALPTPPPSPLSPYSITTFPNAHRSDGEEQDDRKSDYRRQRQFSRGPKVVKSLKDQMIEMQRQQGPAKDPAEPELPEEAAARAMTRNGYNSNGSGPRPAQTARECSYSEFLKCKPLDFKGTEGVVGLTRWFEKMESVFSISNCPATSQVKFATCTLQDDALTWWNSHVKTTTPEVAHAMPWAALKKMMTDKYCPKGEIKKIETEMWNLKVKGTDVVAYNRRFQQLALMCSRMFPEEVDKIEKYIGGLPDMILGSAERKRKYDDLPQNNQTYPQIKAKHRQAYALPERSRPATANNNNRNTNNNNNRNNNNPRAQGANTMRHLCFEEWGSRHFRNNCPQWRNKNQGNGSGVARAYAVGVAGQNPDNNVVTGTFLLNNRCASILFDTGADRSFVSTQFSNLINIAPTTLDHGYNVELADGRIIWVNTVLLGCTLNFLNHPFHVDLMPVEMGTYDVIIGMDWLTKYQAVIDCAKKIVRIPFGSEILIFHGDGSRNKRGTRLNIISCTKAQKYLLQGCHIFLAHITVKETGDKKNPTEEVGRSAVPTKGLIRLLVLSPWELQVLFVKKKDGSVYGLHRLSGTKQTSREDPLSHYQECDGLILTNFQVSECLLEERPKSGITIEVEKKTSERLPIRTRYGHYGIPGYHFG